MLCTECQKSSDHWNHADKNRAGHFFSTAAPILARELDTTPPEIPVKRPREEKPMPTIEDYKWWVRSHRRQRVIRDLLAHRVAAHEAALERRALDSNPDPTVSAWVLPSDIAEDMQAMVDQLTHKLEIRKRVAPDPNLDAVVPRMVAVKVTRAPRRSEERLLMAVRLRVKG